MVANVSLLLLCCLALLVASSLDSVATASSPPIPAWPKQFSVNLTILVEKYSSKFQAKGAMYYNYPKKVSNYSYIYRGSYTAHVSTTAVVF